MLRAEVRETSHVGDELILINFVREINLCVVGDSFPTANERCAPSH